MLKSNIARYILIVIVATIFSGCSQDNYISQVETETSINTLTTTVTTAETTETTEDTNDSTVVSLKIDTPEEMEQYSPEKIEIGGYYFSPDAEELRLFPKDAIDIWQSLDDEDLMKLSQFKDVKVIVTMLDVNQLDYLLNLPLLESVSLSQSYISDDCKGFFSNFKNLQKISLGYCCIDNLDCLYNCSSLKKIEICGATFDDISSVSSLSNLQFLTISVNQFIDLSPLYNLKNLKTLYIDIEQDDDRITELRKALPECEIITAYIG